MGIDSQQRIEELEEKIKELQEKLEEKVQVEGMLRGRINELEKKLGEKDCLKNQVEDNLSGVTTSHEKMKEKYTEMDADE